MSDKPLVLVLAAGLGTRMKSDKAKVLHEVAGRPLICWAVETARAAGADRVVAILGHQHEEVRSVLDARYGQASVDVALQSEQRGTGHAVQCALPALAAEPGHRIVVILTGDAPLLGAERVADLVAACQTSGSGLALLSTQAAAAHALRPALARRPRNAPAHRRARRCQRGRARHQ
jgi:bifunctional UDP-N-acetylglucosamine pyrophosphorylase / glucosamine-1-phosphate N-acetyltransferase